VDCSQAGRIPVVPRASRAGLTLLLLTLAVPGPGAASSWRVVTGDVRISVPLKPGGAFEARSSAIGGELRASGSRPVALKGRVALDLTTIETGIDLRNRHLREKYLEVAKGSGFDKAVLSEVRVAAAESEAFRGRSAFTATLLLHGVTHEVGGECQVKDTAAGVAVEASFPLTLIDFGIEPPEYLGVGVGNKLLVKVALVARGAAE
jgi:polyisoprenoid-binding protein YceI